jgi:hypothetical protein
MHMEDEECTQNGNQKFWTRPRGKQSLKHFEVLEWVSGVDAHGSGRGSVVVYSEHGNELAESTKDRYLMNTWATTRLSREVILSYQDASIWNMFSLQSILKREKCTFDFKMLTAYPHVNFLTRWTIFTKLYMSFVQMAVIPTCTF